MNAAASPVGHPPQYVLVARTLMEDIRGGRYPVGSLLPGEHELCTQFGVSRHTVREAIRQLQDRGMVLRQRGVGTSVRSDGADSRYVQSTATIADLPRYVDETRLVAEHTGDVLVDGALAELLGCPAGQRWAEVTGRRYVGQDGPPLALTHIYVPAAYAAILGMIGTRKVPVYSLLEEQFGVRIGEVRQDISAVVIDAADAERLQVAPGSAGLVVTRRYHGQDGRLVEAAVNLHPADRFSYSMTLRLSPSAGDA